MTALLNLSSEALTKLIIKGQDSWGQNSPLLMVVRSHWFVTGVVWANHESNRSFQRGPDESEIKSRDAKMRELERELRNSLIAQMLHRVFPSNEFHKPKRSWWRNEHGSKRSVMGGHFQLMWMGRLRFHREVKFEDWTNRNPTERKVKIQRIQAHT